VSIYAGTDYNNRPVVFERLGEFFSSGNCHQATDDEWIESYLYFLDSHFAKMRESAIASGEPISKIVFYADFAGVVTSILNRQIWSVIPLLQKIVNTVECHYPEIVDTITLFNVPWVASALWSNVQGFLNPATAAKVEIFPGVPLERFCEVMSESVVPLEYGGTNEMEYPPTQNELE
jgi:hypothetical protein